LSPELIGPAVAHEAARGCRCLDDGPFPDATAMAQMWGCCVRGAGDRHRGHSEPPG